MSEFKYVFTVHETHFLTLLYVGTKRVNNTQLGSFCQKFDSAIKNMHFTGNAGNDSNKFPWYKSFVTEVSMLDVSIIVMKNMIKIHYLIGVSCALHHSIVTGIFILLSFPKNVAIYLSLFINFIFWNFSTHLGWLSHDALH